MIPDYKIALKKSGVPLIIIQIQQISFASVNLYTYKILGIFVQSFPNWFDENISFYLHSELYIWLS